ncbi:hypothetical protein PsYK624_142260 [Phanerochaete sordida]|uniref:Uncharacterized protein n=1 Tax=Phanerochaete sordida TaxID=48140 RepID=A0A9P3LKT8_9APHY|nr:hypothetical protein PsYK624_142260 [Phanerochaete sordida]
MASAQESQPANTTNLPVEAVAAATREAKHDGIFAGLSSGLLGALIGQRFYKFDRNKTILCGVVTGILVGYQFTQIFTSSNLARLRVEQARLAKAETAEQPSGAEPAV